MQRRDFITLFGGAAVSWPLTARAQPAGGKRKVGILMPLVEGDSDSQVRISAFRQGFADLGWKDGQNVQIEYRWAGGTIELIEKYAKELVEFAPDVILVNSTPAVAALKKLTNSIPIVFALANDPVGLGFVKSLSRPGGNITGFTYINPEIIGKWLGLLKEAATGVTRCALLFNPKTTPFYVNFLHEIEAARAPGSTELVPTPVDTPQEIETAINTLALKPGSGLIIGPDPFSIVHIKQIALLTTQNRLPAISIYRQFVIEDGLMAYGPNTADIFRRSAAYVDRILKGAKTADLPVQEPTKFEFMINLKTAKALGLAISSGLLSIADEVIE